MSVEVRPYGPELADEWDALVENARNGLFLFRRGYMDYHADRFEDLSVMAYIEGQVAAVMPVSIDRETGLASSHGGLTFGGPVFHKDLRGEPALEAIDAMLDGLRSWGAKELEVRLIPQFLASYPSAESDFALWRRGFALVRRDLSSVLPLVHPLPLNGMRRRSVAKAEKAGLEASGSLGAFYRLLAAVLEARHGVAPVHTLDELELLQAAFPNRIMLRGVERDGEMLAGVLVYRYPTAWHTQYIAASDQGRTVGALDLLIAGLIDEARSEGATWLSFGTSTTAQGRQLNKGLLWQKESFGARSVTHDFMRGTL